MSLKTSAWIVALILGVAPATLLAAGQPLTPQAVLFDARHLDQVGKGSEVTYKFERTTSNETILGKSFADSIKLGVNKIGDKGEREVVFKVFTGEQAREPTTFPDLSINPIMVWYFERSVNTFSSLAGGNYNYLKKKLIDELQKSAEVEAIKFDYNGKSIDALRIAIRPYADDVSASKMQGYESSQFTIVVSNDAPGYIVDLSSVFESKSATAPRLEEHISLVGIGENK